MKLLVLAHGTAHPYLPELARDPSHQPPEREKLLRFWIETS
jgi:hypothetical protein